MRTPELTNVLRIVLIGDFMGIIQHGDVLQNVQVIQIIMLIMDQELVLSNAQIIHMHSIKLTQPVQFVCVYYLKIVHIVGWLILSIIAA